jgi:hypothetical protein
VVTEPIDEDQSPVLAESTLVPGADDAASDAIASDAIASDAIATGANDTYTDTGAASDRYRCGDNRLVCRPCDHWRRVCCLVQRQQTVLAKKTKIFVSPTGSSVFLGF